MGSEGEHSEVGDGSRSWQESKRSPWPLLKGQKVQNALQVPPQPGLQAEKINVEVPGRWDARGSLFAGIFVGGAKTRVVETPAHQAHLEERRQQDRRLHQLPLPTSLVPSEASHMPQQGEDPVPHAFPLLTWKNLNLRSRKTAPPDSPVDKERQGTLSSGAAHWCPGILATGTQWPYHLRIQAEGHSPLQGFSSPGVPLHRN
jgi:hypothetical protein